ncbi:hypothetical protein L484_026740 [Morus notabilis]|uniref:Uncharacterized protein n=1 Tax=Morus notabilis TaxID=981085 RepID=W9SD54_9ROSA|nr:hypothetical protein L484_026740 [Morus notabilis]
MQDNRRRAPHSTCGGHYVEAAGPVKSINSLINSGNDALYELLLLKSGNQMCLAPFCPFPFPATWKKEKCHLFATFVTARVWEEKGRGHNQAVFETSDGFDFDSEVSGWWWEQWIAAGCGQ